MASKTDLRNVQNLDNPASAVGALNFNFAQIATVIDTLLSRDGSVPNAMQALLDMNNNRIVNLPVPVSPTEPARHGDIQQYVDQAEAAAEFADERAEFAEEQAQLSLDAAEISVDALEEFMSRYLGTHASHPVVNPFDDEPLTDGAIYFNTTVRTWYVWYDYRVMVNNQDVLVGATQVRNAVWEQIPRSTLRSLNDVEANILHNQIYRWNSTQSKFVPVDLAADIVSYDNDGTAFNGGTLQAALDEVDSRTSIGFYDISFWVQGLIEPNERLFRIVASREFEFRTDGSGQAHCRIAPNSNTSLFVNRNGVNIGNIVFLEGENTGTVNISPGYPISVGDIVEIVAPASPDTLMRDTSFTLTARR